MVGKKVKTTIKQRHINSSSKFKDSSDESMKEEEEVRTAVKRKSIHLTNEGELNQKLSKHSGQRMNYLAQSQSSHAETEEAHAKGKNSLRLSLQNVR